MRNLLVFVFVAACVTAPVGVDDVDLDPSSAQRCTSQCRTIGLALDSVVVMANNVGCVCRATAMSNQTGPSALAGMTAIQMQLEAERKQAEEAEKEADAEAAD